mmetsp:Transcript_28723/g.80869  ORF Transcript_28723/g.80869 Transcript_28723/m.80869 type:complete len:118 (+) Transcript_28723:224-577(+)|eukprot:CAMPEP_0117681594 /NCGR_PEP_ID=MMETSP0804-20121206/19078_1 /TAXON_ID=1074897 /ORGANISM="Tetraselmis astigmatica, Strain CCMP880" /LENGTH=117 /DNA_ID=CAMNT_0005491387 /DNA_START=134 /DNA_END=487 /DNA_ORIENTATION=+
MLRQSLRATCRLPIRGLAPKKGGKGKQQAATAGEGPSGVLSATEVTGCNIYKSGSDPAILPDDQYPEWLWDLAQSEPTLRELERKGADNLSMPELKRAIKLDRRATIRANNERRSKN